MFPNKQDIIDLATALRTDPAFLEKDYYVCQLIERLVTIQNENFEVVFCGGTSLLHGYRLISRFSEDADFRIVPKQGDTNRTDRRNFRKGIIAALSEVPDISIIDGSVRSRDESRFFGVLFSYPRLFPEHASIRPHIKLECSFEDEIFPGVERRLIRPVLGDHIEAGIEFEIPCLSLHETTSDKISALTWRVLDRHKNDDVGDPSIVRHLYDIDSIMSYDKERLESYVQSASQIYLRDRLRRGGVDPETLKEAGDQVLDILRQTPLYKEEYEQYVKAMCFGPIDPPGYEQTIDTYASVAAQA